MAARSTTRFEYSAARPEPHEKCPCGSAKIYVRCCAKQDIEWRKQPDGTWARGVPIGPEARAILDAEAAEFKELFGRKPRGRTTL